MKSAKEYGIARREYIKYALRLRGTSLTELSRELRVSISTLSQVCRGDRSSARLRIAVARKLSCKPKEIWEERSFPGEAA